MNVINMNVIKPKMSIEETIREAHKKAQEFSTNEVVVVVVQALDHNKWVSWYGAEEFNSEKRVMLFSMSWDVGVERVFARTGVTSSKPEVIYDTRPCRGV